LDSKEHVLVYDSAKYVEIACCGNPKCK